MLTSSLPTSCGLGAVGLIGGLGTVKEGQGRAQPLLSSASIWMHCWFDSWIFSGSFNVRIPQETLETVPMLSDTPTCLIGFIWAKGMAGFTVQPGFESDCC